MKNLVPILGTIVITGTVPGLVVNNSQQVNQNEVFSQVLYWNSAHENEELSLSVSPGQTQSSHKWFTFNIGKTNNFSDMYLENSKGFSFSWGETRYGPWSFDSKRINFDKSNNVKITDSNFNKHLQFEVYDYTVKDFLAQMHSIVKIGYAWYQEGGDYYFQFLVSQMIHSINSLTGGANFANLGTNLRLD